MITKMANKFPGRCGQCGGQVKVGEGFIIKVAGKWYLAHTECPTPPPITHHASGDVGLAKVIGEHEFKPDASAPKPGAVCAKCGTTNGVAWIAGAGEYLCYRHQDDY